MIKEKLISKKKTIKLSLPENYLNKEIEVSVKLISRRRKKRNGKKGSKKINNTPFKLKNSKPAGNTFPSKYMGIYKITSGDLEKEISELRNEWERNVY